MTDADLNLEGLVVGLAVEGRVPLRYAIAGDAWLAAAWAAAWYSTALLNLIALAGEPRADEVSEAQYHAVHHADHYGPALPDDIDEQWVAEVRQRFPCPTIADLNRAAAEGRQPAWAAETRQRARRTA